MSSIFRKPLESERNINASLYFGNIDPQVSEPLLYELFIQFGPIKSINLPKDRILKTHQGFGFVEFRSIKDAEYTINILRGVRLYGRTLNIKKTEPYKGGNTQRVGTTNGTMSTNTPDSGIDVGAKLFIKNLNPLIDEKYLSDTMSKFGNLIRPPSIIRDPDTGISKGYGFLTFDDFNSSDLVIEKMNGNILMNSTVSISYAFKEDGTNGVQKKVRHGDKVERLLAESAKSNNVLASSNKLKVNESKRFNDKSNKITKPRGKRSKQ